MNVAHILSTVAYNVWRLFQRQVPKPVIIGLVPERAGPGYVAFFGDDPNCWGRGLTQGEAVLNVIMKKGDQHGVLILGDGNFNPRAENPWVTT